MSTITHNPHLFFLVKIDGELRLFCSWYGGYAGADEWRLSRAITGFKEDEAGLAHFDTANGVRYIAALGAYGSSSYAEREWMWKREDFKSKGVACEAYENVEECLAALSKLGEQT